MKGAPVALVTGAARGLGLTMVERLLAEGYRVMAADLAAAGEHWNYALGDIGDLATRLADYGEEQLKTCALDVTSAASCQAALALSLIHI